MTSVPVSGAVRATSPRGSAAASGGSYSSLLSTVRDLGLLRRQRYFYVIMASALMVALGGCAVGFILLGHSWFQLLIAGALGIVFTQFAFLGHEASHRQILSSGPANDRMGRVLAAGMVGISYSWWMNKHTRHHGNPNVIGRDPDIERDTVSFLERDAERARGPLKLITRYQGWMFWPMLPLEGLNLHLKSFMHLVSDRKVELRGLELTMVIVRLAALTTAVFLVLPMGMAFAFMAVQLAVFGVYMGAAFAPNHIGMTVFPEGTKIDYLRKQVLSSRNIRGGWFVTILFGGLNLQAEHHLFPSMPRPHLLRARHIVREHCAVNKIAYTEETIPQAYAGVFRYLRQVGRSAPGMVFFCPLVARYGRL